jgi:FkbM family methyltransferase
MRKLQLRHLGRWFEVCRCFQRCERPWMLVRRYLSGSESSYPFMLRLSNGMQIRLDCFHDLVTAWIVFLREEYKVQPEASTILDIGANIGLFSLYAAFGTPTRRIIAAEPFPDTYSRLSVNVAENQLENRVCCWPLGIAAHSGTRWMNYDGPSQSRGIAPDSIGPTDGVRVTVVSFDELLRRACDRLNTDLIDFVKLDIEGAEHESLLAASRHALRRVHRLGLEYHPNCPKRPLFNHLRSTGFNLEHDRRFGADVGVAHFSRT